MKLQRALGLAASAALLVACGRPGGEPMPPQDPTRSASPAPAPAATPSADARVEAARDDAARRFGVPVDQVRVLEQRSVTWPDGSLGCPAPGEHYTQALVPGRLLILDVAGQRREYHAGRDQAYAYCADPTPPRPGDTGDS